MAIIQTTTAWGAPVWIDQSTGEQVADPSISSYTAPQQGNAYGQVAGKFLSGGYADGQLQDNSAWNNPDGSVTWLIGGKPQVLSQADWDKEMARQVAADRGPLGALMELGTQFVLPAFGAYSLASNLGGLLGGNGATSGLGYQNAFDSGAMADAMGYTPYSDLTTAANNYGWSDGASAPTDYTNELKKAASDYGWSDNASLGGNADINGMPTGLLDSLKLDPSKLAKAAMGLLGGSTPTPQQSSPVGGGSSGYQANIQPDMGLLALNKPQYANIFQTQALQPIYGSQRGY